MNPWKSLGVATSCHVYSFQACWRGLSPLYLPTPLPRAWTCTNLLHCALSFIQTEVGSPVSEVQLPLEWSLVLASKEQSNFWGGVDQKEACLS